MIREHFRPLYRWSVITTVEYFPTIAHVAHLKVQVIRLKNVRYRLLIY